MIYDKESDIYTAVKQLDKVKNLTHWEVNFIGDMVNKFAKYGDNTMLTASQVFYIEKMEYKYLL